MDRVIFSQLHARILMPTIPTKENMVNKFNTIFRSFCKFLLMLRAPVLEQFKALMLCCDASQFVITFQFVINYYKLERICYTIASQFVINYYKLERICTAIASQIVINYYKLARICNVFAFQFVIKYCILDDSQSTLENKG